MEHRQSMILDIKYFLIATTSAYLKLKWDATLMNWIMKFLIFSQEVWFFFSVPCYSDSDTSSYKYGDSSVRQLFRTLYPFISIKFFASLSLNFDLFSFSSFCFRSVPEYCQRYAKPEDVGNDSDGKSSDEELSEDNEYDSSDEQVVGKPDPWLGFHVNFCFNYL